MNGPALRLLFLTACLAGGSCLASDNPSGGPDGGPREQNPMFFAQDYARAVCDKAFECCTRLERTESTLFDGTRDSCPDTLLDKGIPFNAKQSDAADVVRSISAGRITYHPERAAACLARVKAMTCEQAAGGFWTTSACDAVVATVPLGGTCATSEECKAGACVKGSTGTRACSTPLGDATRCTEDDQCLSGQCTFADPMMPDPTVLLCTAKKKEGALCDDGGQSRTGRCRDNICRPGAGPALCSR
jgi:hypothetical protein